MKKILKRGFYIMKAKGRHGTHSPFVYAFVEKVLRDKTKFVLQNNVAPFSKKETAILGRALQYLKPVVVYADDAMAPFLKQLQLSNTTLHFEIQPMLDESNYIKDGLFFCLPTEKNVAFLKKQFSKQSQAAIVLHQHKTKEAFEIWESLGEDLQMKMVMDVWHFGFVSNHSDFKMKQFFRLR